MHYFCPISFCFLSILLQYPVVHGSYKERTPSSIESIFKARCMEYQEIVRPDLFQNGTKNCTHLWDLFARSFSYKSACSINPEDYKPLIEAADHYIDTTDKVMYWSGNIYPFVIRYASHGKRYTTIRNQLAVYSLDTIEHWCGQTTYPGINYKDCPSWGYCPLLATTSFWKQMSKSFVNKLRGTVYIMLNGTVGGAYRRGSIFSQSELANLDRSRTPILNVLLVNNLGVTPNETCGTGSLLELKEDVLKKGMIFKCTENDPSIMFFQCVDQPNLGPCQRHASTGVRTDWSMPILGFALIMYRLFV